MGLKDLDVLESYDTGSGHVDVVRDFYEPCLDNSTSYDRLSGYFSSRVLALAARGLGGFLAGDGKMRLITSANIATDDMNAILSMSSEPSKRSAFDLEFEKALDDRFKLETLLEQNHLDAMCWLLKHGRLEIRIVVPRNTGQARNALFHSKVGIFADSDGDTLSFSGSVNETIYGWTQNIEEFKVFKSWNVSTSSFAQHDANLFEKYWNPPPESGYEALPLSDAVKAKLIAIAPDDAPNIRVGSRSSGNTNKPLVRLRDYQLEAVECWVDAGRQGLFAMATGTGKTKTATACVEHVQALGPSLTVVTAPFQHIADQWVKELDGKNPILASGNSGWVDEFKHQISRRKLARTNHIVVVAVQNTAANVKFLSLCNEAKDATGNFLFVGDEAHGLGATTFQSALNPSANFRLGLSATPVRYFDETGTDMLIDYFGETCFEFDTTKALTWVDPISGQTPLCPYDYKPLFTNLTFDETKKYEELSEKIRKLTNSENRDGRAALERLLFLRAGILKKAANKLPLLEELLSEIGSSISDCLIYCNDFEQLSQVASILSRNGITFQKITGDESSSQEARFGNRSERDWILDNFSKGLSQVLLAIKCLDEGVDIPSAKLGIILASSGNPREFIQRRGRLMRRFEGKSKAIIYDFVVAPMSSSSEPVSGIDLSIFKKELARIDEFAKDALNRAEVHLEVTRKLGELI